MSLIFLRQLPKNSFTSIVFPHLKTFNSELGVLDNTTASVNVGNCNFTLENNMEYDYQISELEKTTTINTKISTTINNTLFNIYEKITIKRNLNLYNNIDYSNYSINIVNLNNQPYIRSIKCIEQPLSFDLMNHYTDDIKNMYKQIIININNKN